MKSARPARPFLGLERPLVSQGSWGKRVAPGKSLVDTFTKKELD